MIEHKCRRCGKWQDTSLAEHQIRVLTGHHVRCEMQGSELRAAVALIDRLVDGIEAWAAEEGGVHHKVWDPYRQAKALYYVYLPPKQEERKS